MTNDSYFKGIRNSWTQKMVTPLSNMRQREKTPQIFPK